MAAISYIYETLIPLSPISYLYLLSIPVYLINCVSFVFWIWTCMISISSISSWTCWLLQAYVSRKICS
ncbi:hypothetical protein BDW62DRAFT_66837 [Aspergillus aurantiobrunneus]